MFNVQDYNVLFANTVRPVICEGWHFTHVWKTIHYEWKYGRIQLALSATFYGNTCTKPGKSSVMYVCVSGIEYVFFSFFY